MADPARPSAKEVEEHELTHLPFRNWCRECVHGRGVEMPHRRQIAEDKKLMELHCDFMFLGPQDVAGETIPVLVIREAVSKMTLSAAVPRKTVGTFVAKRVLAFMEEVGCLHGDVVVKSDQEPAILAVLSDIGRMRAAAGGGKWISENSPVGASASNGVAERAIQAVQHQVRVMKLALERRWGMRIPHKHSVVPWIIEYASFLLNRFEVSHDGKTAYERLKGRRAKVLGLEFGEAIHWRARPSRGALGKLDSLWDDGVFLGVRGKSGEVIVGNKTGVWKSRTIRRKPIEDRWASSSAGWIVGVPWNMSDDDVKADGEKYETVILPPAALEDIREEGQKSMPRNVAISKADLEAHGYTLGCGGCKAILKGTSRQGHSQGCRSRFNEVFQGTEKFQKAQARCDTFTERVMQEEDDRKRRRLVAGGGSPRIEGQSAAAASSSTSGPEAMRSTPMETGEERGCRNPPASSLGPEPKRPVTIDAEAGPEPKKPRPDAEMNVDSVVDAEARESDDEECDWVPEVTDSRTGQILDPKLVETAREEELKFMEGFGIFEETSVEECRRETGRMPVDTKWVDVNKGSEAEPVVRSRLVARDFKPKGEKERGDLFAAMPPLEAKKMLFSIAASHPRVLRRGKWMRPKLMFIDVKKAHLNGVVKDEERAYVSMPGDPPGRCRRLRKWLYGMRPAANAWEEDFSGKLAGMGLKAGKSSSVVFCDVEREVRCVVHGDDFTFLAYEDDLERLRVAMSEAYLMTVRGVLGPDPKDQKEITILNRKLVWSEGGLTYEADANHARKILEDMGLHASSNGLDKPCIKETAQDIEQDDVELDPQEMTSFRSIAARANYLAQDRPDLQFATKEICRRMAKPTRGCWTAMKRLARYLVQYPRLVFTFADLGYIPDSIQVCSDSDWAGCLRTRKSTSGGVVVLGETAVKHWSSTQTTRALSSGEAELVAFVKAASEGIGAQSLAADLGLHVRVDVFVDSSAAIGMSNRTGVGRVRHLDVKDLWVQEQVRRKRIYLHKIRGDLNPADLGTKPLSVAEMTGKLKSIGAEIISRKMRWSDASEEDEGY